MDIHTDKLFGFLRSANIKVRCAHGIRAIWETNVQGTMECKNSTIFSAEFLAEK